MKYLAPLFVWLAALLSACVPGANKPGPDCKEVDLFVIDDAFTPADRAGIVDGIAAWHNSTGGRVCFIEAPDPKSRVDLHIRAGHTEQFVKIMGPFGVFVIGLTLHRDIWLMPTDEIIVSGFPIRDTTAHEIGHYLGLMHSTEGLMQSSGGHLTAGGNIPPVTLAEWCDMTHWCAGGMASQLP